MSHGIWNSFQKARTPRQPLEKAYRRQNLLEWDDRWEKLSVEARRAFLKEVKGPNSESSSTPHSGVPIALFDSRVLSELVQAKFVEIVEAKAKGKTVEKAQRVVAVPGSYDFAVRLRSLHLLKMLDPTHLDHISKYLDTNAYSREIVPILQAILVKSGLQSSVILNEILVSYVVHYRWVGRVAYFLDDRVADQILKVLLEADGPILITELPKRIGSSDLQKVRTVLNTLIERLVVFEDLTPEKLDIVVGLLPLLREATLQRARPSVRPALIPCETPVDIGPETSMIVEDVRAFLLEIASDPPRLRRDLTFFAKEIDRFAEALMPLPVTLVNTLGWSRELRLNQAGLWTRLLQLVKDEIEGEQINLRLTPKGNRWLAGSLTDQYSSIFESLIVPVKTKDRYSRDEVFLYYNAGLHDIFDRGDVKFLGTAISAFKSPKGRPVQLRERTTEAHTALRESVYAALSEIPLDSFYPAGNVYAHLAYGPRNPVNLGMDLDKVTVYRGSRAVPPIDEERDEVGRELLSGLIHYRLLPLGCFRAAMDTQGRLCIARTSRLDAYFGRKVSGEDLAGTADVESRVVVQPDFSVIIIGLNPGPAAALSPFCERSTRGNQAGAMVLKLTRESVVRAIAQGLKPSEIVGRLKQHASVEVPASVLKEVENWSGWVRQITSEPMTVLRCPDRDTADRVMSALKKQAERINDTLVAIDMIKLTAAERNKLRDHGILLKTDTEVSVNKAARRKPGRRS